jgi:hypothetical protein
MLEIIEMSVLQFSDFPKESTFSSTRDEWGADHNSEIHIAGRIVLNLWRLLRHEVNIGLFMKIHVAQGILLKSVIPSNGEHLKNTYGILGPTLMMHVVSAKLIDDAMIIIKVSCIALLSLDLAHCATSS